MDQARYSTLLTRRRPSSLHQALFKGLRDPPTWHPSVHPPAWHAGRPAGQTAHPSQPLPKLTHASSIPRILSNPTSKPAAQAIDRPAGAHAQPQPGSAGRLMSCAWPWPRPRPPAWPPRLFHAAASSIGSGRACPRAPWAPSAFLRDWHPNNGRAAVPGRLHMPCLPSHRCGHRLGRIQLVVLARATPRACTRRPP
jgi:hypothetical protein